MKPKNLIIYFLVFIILGLFFYFYDVKLAQKEADLEESENKIFHLKFEDITALAYKNKDHEIRMVREQPDAWRYHQTNRHPGRPVGD